MPGFWEFLFLAPLPKFKWVLAIWPIISHKCDSRHFSTKVCKSFLRVKMLNRCGFWGKRDTFVWKFSLLGDEWSPLRAFSACGQILKKNPGKGQTPSHPGIVFWDRMVHQPLSYFSTDSKCQKVKKDSFRIQIQWVMANAGVVTWDLRQSKSLLGGEGVKWEWDGMLAGWGKWGDQKGAAETGRNCKKVGGRVG